MRLKVTKKAPDKFRALFSRDTAIQPIAIICKFLL